MEILAPTLLGLGMLLAACAMLMGTDPLLTWAMEAKSGD